MKRLVALLVLVLFSSQSQAWKVISGAYTGGTPTPNICTITIDTGAPVNTPTKTDGSCYYVIPSTLVAGTHEVSAFYQLTTVSPHLFSGLSAVTFTVSPYTILATNDFENYPRASYHANGLNAFYSWDNQQSHSPTHSLKIINKSTASAAWMTNTNGVAAGQEFCAYVYAKGALGGVVLQFKSRGGAVAESVHGSSAANASVWGLMEACGSVPVGTYAVTTEFQSQGPGTIWFDDMTLTIQ
jgi:hypothetical protein